MSITRHPEYQSFIAAVIAAPDDDLPRLQFSDWLDERGDERGEFIKVQIELEGMEDEARAVAGMQYVDPLFVAHRHATFRGRPISKELWDRIWRCQELQRREQTLLRLNEHWDCLPQPSFAILSGEHRRGYNERHFRRGFVESIVVESATWFNHHEAILSQNPLKEVTLTTYPEITFRERDDETLQARIIYATTNIGGKRYVSSGAVSLQSLRDHRHTNPIGLARDALASDMRRNILSQWPNLKIKYEVPDPNARRSPTRYATAGTSMAPGRLVRLDHAGYATAATSAPARNLNDAMTRQELQFLNEWLPAQRAPDGTLPGQMLRSQDGTPFAFEYQQHHDSEEQMLADARAYHVQAEADAMRSPMMQFDNLPPIPNPHFPLTEDDAMLANIMAFQTQRLADTLDRLGGAQQIVDAMTQQFDDDAQRLAQFTFSDLPMTTEPPAFDPGYDQYFQQLARSNMPVLPDPRILINPITDDPVETNPHPHDDQDHGPMGPND